jgi:hypothetical protein
MAAVTVASTANAAVTAGLAGAVAVVVGLSTPPAL